MTARPAIPLDLRIVAYLLLLYGSIALAGAIWALVHRSLHFDLGVLAIPAALGLRRGARGWRVFALSYLVLGLLGFVAIATILIISTVPMPIHFAGLPVPWEHKGPLVACAIAFGLLHLWMLRVLTREDIRELFAPRELADA